MNLNLKELTHREARVLMNAVALYVDDLEDVRDKEDPPEEAKLRGDLKIGRKFLKQLEAFVASLAGK